MRTRRRWSRIRSSAPANVRAAPAVRRGRPSSILWTLSHGYGYLCRDAAPKHVELDLSSNPVSPQQVEEILRRLNRVGIQCQNDVAHEKTARGGGTVRRDGGDEQAGPADLKVGTTSV